MFSARFDKQDEEEQVLDEIDLYINLNINRNIGESGIDNIDLRSQLDEQIQNQETKDSKRRFAKFNSITLFF